ncbi:thioredoxin [Nocardioides sp. Soil777]|uniref:thioredoxin family protein n=1 Tax=Nocardioides sp. Soil777 TaxID=1736409 RepID=UPI0007030305|nr:thioredoxin family protein [Nocardioides sp. Soil777]KRF02628.1 thioredoxin [Nocardioides sp. Soil777]
MTTGAWILVAAVVLALAVGLWRAATDGRFRGTHQVRGADDGSGGAAGPETPVETPPGAALVAEVGETLGERATLLQFSSAFCAPCRATRRILADVAEVVPGVAHVEVDAEHHLEAVRRLGVLRTPTTIVLAADGTEVTRAAGAPRKEQVLAALATTD